MVLPESVQQPASLSQRERSHLFWYVVPLMVGPLLILVAAFLVVPTEWFARRANDPWLHGIGYGANFQNTHCEILLYGDSTAELGLDPATIEKRTGMTACNLAEEAGLIRLDGNFVLDRYLQHNAPPRVLLMVFGSEVFNSRGRARYPIFEPLTYEMGQARKMKTLKSIANNPEDFFRWIYKGVHMAMRVALSKPISVEALHERERTGGRLTIDDIRMTVCSDSRDNPLPDRTWIADLRTRYSRPGTLLLMEVMPLPSCDPGFETVSGQFDGLMDFKVQQLPGRYYFRGGRHVDTDGAVVFSNMAADQILDSLKASAEPAVP